jgi:hypothetical protein
MSEPESRFRQMEKLLDILAPDDVQTVDRAS